MRIERILDNRGSRMIGTDPRVDVGEYHKV
jgi:hypothetical protein